MKCLLFFRTQGVKQTEPNSSVPMQGQMAVSGTGGGHKSALCHGYRVFCSWGVCVEGARRVGQRSRPDPSQSWAGRGELGTGRARQVWARLLTRAGIWVPSPSTCALQAQQTSASGHVPAAADTLTAWCLEAGPCGQIITTRGPREGLPL